MPSFPKLNVEWHKEHRMPAKATANDRLAWHVDHAKHCLCRPFTKAMREKLEAEVAKKQ